MSLVPAFEIGVWNAWTLAVAFLLLVYIPQFVLKDYSKKMGQGEHYGKSETFMKVLFVILLIFSIFLPLRLGTAWFYTGLIIYLLGLIKLTITILVVAYTPLGKPFTKGTYRYSRNPGYVGQIFVFVGIGIASASWLCLLLSIILIFLTFLLVGVEERITLDKLGESYREYMNKTPRWLGIPKSVKSK
jgi:protein-S-isoprenylcysteine O-methyltransferase Ste14